MPIRSVKKYSDRGSLIDLIVARVAKGDELYDTSPTEEELRLKKLYEHAEATRDQQLKESLGFIVMPNPGDRAAFPISVYRHREYIASLSMERAAQIEQVKQELVGCFTQEFRESMPVRISKLKQITATQAVQPTRGLMKFASAIRKQKSSFTRVR